MSEIVTGSRVLADGYDSPGEVLMILARPDGRLAKVRHDDGLENYYRIHQLRFEGDGKVVPFARKPAI